MKLSREAAIQYLFVGDSAGASIEVLNVEITDSYRIDFNRDGIIDFMISYFYQKPFGGPSDFPTAAVGHWILKPLSENNKVLCDTVVKKNIIIAYQRRVEKDDTIKVNDPWFSEPLHSALLGMAGSPWGFSLFMLSYGSMPAPLTVRGLDTEYSSHDQQKYIGLISYSGNNITLGWIKVCLYTDPVLVILEEIGSVEFNKYDNSYRLNHKSDICY